MPLEIAEWMDTVSGREWIWYVKVLSANDTLATRSHQAGPYVPRDVAFKLFPSLLVHESTLNPRVAISVLIDSHGVKRDVNVIWYNNRVTDGGSRNECRITNWGGAASPMLDPDSTGSICVMAFAQPRPGMDAEGCRAWICSSIEEEDTVEDRLGAIEPGIPALYDPAAEIVQPVRRGPVDVPCTVTAAELPAGWLLEFPDAAAIVSRAVASLPSVMQKPADDRLLNRRDCEFELFRSVEQLVVLPRIREGFATVDLFVGFALSVTNRRKSRSGMSLELQTRTILDEDGVSYAHGKTTEGRKRPDFLFPSAEAYHDPAFPDERLRMLAVKTTCKDRWRQILNEADRIPTKHLLTLQHGVSENQFAEMRAAHVTLVVPRKLHLRFPKSVRPYLVTLNDFIRSAAALSV